MPTLPEGELVVHVEGSLGFRVWERISCLRQVRNTVQNRKTFKEEEKSS